LSKTQSLLPQWGEWEHRAAHTPNRRHCGYPNHVVEQALAHTIGNAVERAYRRGDLFEKRVALMNDWTSYLLKSPAEVVPLQPGTG
jgi:hypothetical protein